MLDGVDILVGIEIDNWNGTSSSSNLRGSFIFN